MARENGGNSHLSQEPTMHCTLPKMHWSCRHSPIEVQTSQSQKEWLLAPVPLSIFRSNSKFDENSKHSSVKYTWPITTIFCTRHDSVIVVTCAKYRCDRSSIFETRAFWIFIENMLSGTGASPFSYPTDSHTTTWQGLCSSLVVSL